MKPAERNPCQRTKDAKKPDVVTIKIPDFALPLASVFLATTLAVASDVGRSNIDLQTPVPIEQSTDEMINTSTARLNRLVSELPSTPIKDMLAQRVIPYFQGPYPRKITRAGIDFNLYDAGINITEMRQENTIEGNAVLYDGALSGPQGRYFTAGPIEYDIPYLGLLTESEKQQHMELGHTFGIDRELLIKVRNRPNFLVLEGFRPRITVSSQPMAEINPARRGVIAAVKDFTLVKEAVTLALVDVWIEEVVKSMQANELPIFHTVKTHEGSLVSVEMITPTFSYWMNDKGKTFKAFDVAAVLVTDEAMRGTIAGDMNRNQMSNADIFERIPYYNFGQDPRSILLSSLQVAITSPDAQLLVRKGDINKFP